MFTSSANIYVLITLNNITFMFTSSDTVCVLITLNVTLCNVYADYTIALFVQFTHYGIKFTFTIRLYE